MMPHLDLVRSNVVLTFNSTVLISIFNLFFASLDFLQV
jgi:hypothetical protein